MAEHNAMGAGADAHTKASDTKMDGGAAPDSPLRTTEREGTSRARDIWIGGRHGVDHALQRHKLQGCHSEQRMPQGSGCSTAAVRFDGNRDASRVERGRADRAGHTDKTTRRIDAGCQQLGLEASSSIHWPNDDLSPPRLTQ